MMYKILMFDGRPVETVLYDRIVYCEQDKVRLLDHRTTIDDLVKKSSYKEPWASKCAALIRKCELEEVELRFTKKI